MSCEHVRPLISALAGGPVAPEERDAALAHLEACQGCTQRYDELRSLRAATRSLAATPAPPILLEKLRVSASHERARRLTRVTWAARWENACSSASLYFDNLMRPVALPVAGGIISALLMFGVLIPSVSFARVRSSEPPSPVFTLPDGILTGEGEFPRLEQTYTPETARGTVVLLTIDDHGRVRDYAVKRGAMTQEVQDFILFSVFTPATMFGKPTWSQVRAVFGVDTERRS